MGALRLVCILSSLSVLPIPVSARPQHHPPSAEERGAMAMGFDQAQTSHHFLLFTDGGAIDVSVKSPTDAINRDAIRSHLPQIATMFGDGNFDTPMFVHDSKNVPGTGVMSARKSAIRYRYVETPGGGRVDIVTTDPEALRAVHAFMKFQIEDHHTGDPLTVLVR